MCELCESLLFLQSDLPQISKTNYYIMLKQMYETPKTEVVKIMTEQALLVESTLTGSSVEDANYFDNIEWNL